VGKKDDLVCVTPGLCTLFAPVIMYRHAITNTRMLVRGYDYYVIIIQLHIPEVYRFYAAI
jgi:hypothetical protein